MTTTDEEVPIRREPVSRHLLHGAVAGLAGGAALGLVLLVLGQGPLGRAVALEGAGPAEPELFGRGAQQAGGLAAALLFGLALGAVFGVVFAVLRPRLSGDDWRAAVRLAGIGFVTVSLVPFLKYPANPPGVGDPGTVGRRAGLYLVLLGWSLVATWAAWRAHRRLVARSVGEHLRVPAVAAVHVVLVLVGLLALAPGPDPGALPASVLWRFRLASLAGAGAFWAVTGTVFGWLRLRTLRPAGVVRPRAPARS